MNKKTPHIPMLQNARIQRFFDQLASEIIPETELQWNTPLNLVIAVVLSAQCTDKMVNRATSGFFDECRNANDYLRLGEDGFREKIKRIGLFRGKARNVIGLCQMIRDEFSDRIPDTREELQRLPGVGRKTANVVLNELHGQATLAVDTHIFRVANRVGLARTNTPDATEQVLLRKVPPEHLKAAHHYMILHGRYVCKARTPECWRCSVSDVCNYPKKTPAP